MQVMKQKGLGMGRKKKCDKNCLQCKMLRCIYDSEDREEYVSDVMRKKDRERHKRYYLENKEAIDAKQKEYDKQHNAERCHRYWEAHKEELKEKHHLRYLKDREKRLKYAKERYELNKEEINRKRREKRRLAKESKL